MQTFVSKSRRQRFELTLKIIDLNNVPLVSGTSFVKWHLPHSSSAEHRGKSSKCAVKDHKVIYDYEKVLPVRLTVDKAGVLNEASIAFEVLQEYSSGSRSERIVLGIVTLNLSEYVGLIDEDGDEGLTRRYLMQKSKINSTLKIGISMKFVEGDRNFTAPPLKSAPVFGGIAGIMAGEQGDAEDSGYVASLSYKSKEAGELQDMYRKTLTAYWTALPGELKADECIEDIFAGGTGWANNDIHLQSHQSRGGDGGPLAGLFSKKPRSPREHQPPPEYRQRQGDSSSGHSESNTSTGPSGRRSLEQRASQLKSEQVADRSKSNHAVDELEIRENLCSWKLPDEH